MTAAATGPGAAGDRAGIAAAVELRACVTTRRRGWAGSGEVTAGWAQTDKQPYLDRGGEDKVGPRLIADLACVT